MKFFRFPSRNRPVPPTHNNEKLMPDLKMNAWDWVWHNWVGELLMVGYTRPIEAEDLWQLDVARKVETSSKRLEELFYSRCESHLRPRHLRDKEATPLPQDPLAEKPMDEKADDCETLHGPGPSVYPAGLAVALQPRRGSAVSGVSRISRVSRKHEKERRDAFNQEIAALSLGGGDGASVRYSHTDTRFGVSRFASRMRESTAMTEEEIDVEMESKEVRDPRYDRSLIVAMVKLCWKTVLYSVISYLINYGLRFGSTVLTENLIRYISDSQAYNTTPSAERIGKGPGSIGIGLAYAIAIPIMLQIAALSEQWGMAVEREAAWILRASLWDLIAKKALRMSPRARLINTTGRMTTALSADAMLIQEGIPWIADLFGLFNIALGAGLLARLLGPSAFVGVGMYLAMWPIFAFIIAKQVKYRKIQLKAVDGRVNVMTEILKRVAGVKLYGYEATSWKRVFGLRQKEIQALKTNILWDSLAEIVVWGIPPVALLMTLVTYSLLGHPLAPSVIFSSVQIFLLLQTPVRLFPLSIRATMDSKVAADRIQTVLLSEDIDFDLSINPAATAAVTVTGSFTFDSFPDFEAKQEVKSFPHVRMLQKKGGKTHHTADNNGPEEEAEREADAFHLHDINLTVMPGQLVASCGRVGSGKSAFLEALIGEMRRTTGAVAFNGTVAYFQQSPWIQSASVLDNILFGNNLDQAKMNQVIDACCLGPDLEAMEAGIHTQVGERGKTLSGGQAARVALARAAYSSADIIIMDDPLAAVDPHVAKAIFSKCIMGLMVQKTRILITHDVEILPHADMVLVFQDGHIIQQGSYDLLRGQSGVLRELMDEFGNSVSTSLTGDSTSKALDEKYSAKEGPVQVDTDSGTLVKEETSSAGQGHTLDEAEERETGSVSWKVYGAYIRYLGGYGPATFLSLVLILDQVFATATILFLSFWTDGSIKGFDQTHYIAVYTGLSLGGAVVYCINYPLMSLAALRASKQMFEKAFVGLLRAPLSFHDVQPTGRLISRMSNDIEHIDTSLMQQFFPLVTALEGLLGTVGIIIYCFNWLGFFFIPTFAVYYLTLHFYKRTSIEAKRLESVARSYVYISFGEMLDGVATIRAYQAEGQYIADLEQAINNDSRIYHIQIGLLRWLSVRTNLYGNILVAAVSLFGILYRGKVSAGTIGLALVYTIGATGTLNYLTQEWTVAEQNFNSCERILHYIDAPQEAAPTLPTDPPADWPQHGKVEVLDVQMRYRPNLPLVLKGVTFTCQPGEKIGIVGRTGQGKTSLLSTMLRLVELSGGSIKIDGVDLSTIGLDTLRNRLSCIPQNPLLFSGTMRENLDPQGRLTDAQLNDVLLKCGLIPPPTAPAHEHKRLEKFKLDKEVSASGDNFSAGECQMLAVARAMVKGSKVMFLDEATAATDPETDATIQRTIQTYFGDCTILCIAHRLLTIAYYDKVLVLDGGRVTEFASPIELYDQKGSRFRSMADAAKLGREIFCRV